MATALISPPLATALFTPVTDSLSFWLIRYTRPIYHWQSTDTPPTINGQRIGWVSATISADYRQVSQSICRPSLGRYTSVDMSVDWHISVDIWVLRVGRYVDRYIGRGVHKIHMIRKTQARFKRRPFHVPDLMLLLSTWEVRRMNQLGSTDLYSGWLYHSIWLGLSDRTAKDRFWFIHWSSHVPNLMHNY